VLKAHAAELSPAIARPAAGPAVERAWPLQQPPALVWWLNSFGWPEARRLGAAPAAKHLSQPPPQPAASTKQYAPGRRASLWGSSGVSWVRFDHAQVPPAPSLHFPSDGASHRVLRGGRLPQPISRSRARRLWSGSRGPSIRQRLAQQLAAWPQQFCTCNGIGGRRGWSTTGQGIEAADPRLPPG